MLRIQTNNQGLITITDVIKLLNYLKIEYETDEIIDSSDYTEYIEVE